MCCPRTHTLPIVYLARHGETAWTISHQHTGLTDLALTAPGEADEGRTTAEIHAPGGDDRERYVDCPRNIKEAI